MKILVKKTDQLNGSAIVPGSKSQTIRGLAIATMARGVSVLHNALDSSDTTAAIEVCRVLGVRIKRNGSNLEIESNGLPLMVPSSRLFTGNSGITTRFVMPMLGLRADCESVMVLDCGMQMKSRPIKPLLVGLNCLGMRVESINDDGACPVRLRGRLLGGEVEIDGLTSQYLSSLLFSLPCASRDSVVLVKNLHERPYVEMTLAWLNEQGIKYKHEYENGVDVYKIIGNQRYHSFNKLVPGDFSSASYFIAAGTLLGGQITLNGLDMNDCQGDKRLIEILQSMGADIKFNEFKMDIYGGNKLVGKIIDCNDIPDMVPTLAVIATQAKGKTKLVNVGQARIKETDRLKSMAEGLSRLGARIEETSDGLVIYESHLQGGDVYGYEDHRTVMALAVAGLIANGQTLIDTAESVNKTFPGFVEIMQSLGADLVKIL